MGVSAGAPAAIAAPARPRASLRDDSRVAQLNLRIVNTPPAPVIHTTYSSGHNTLLRGPAESGQFTSWGFSQNVRDAGLAPSMGAVGSPYDNAMVEAFWGRMQVELLNRRRWKTRIELASAIHDYIELFHNTRRRHSALGMLTPTEAEAGLLTAQL